MNRLILFLIITFVITTMCFVSRKEDAPFVGKYEQPYIMGADTELSGYCFFPGGLIINAGVTCTVLPGTVLQFNGSASWVVLNGNMEVLGTSEHPVIINNLSAITCLDRNYKYHDSRYYEWGNRVESESRLIIRYASVVSTGKALETIPPCAITEQNENSNYVGMPVADFFDGTPQYYEPMLFVAGYIEITNSRIERQSQSNEPHFSLMRANRAVVKDTQIRYTEAEVTTFTTFPRCSVATDFDGSQCTFITADEAVIQDVSVISLASRIALFKGALCTFRRCEFRNSEIRCSNGSRIEMSNCVFHSCTFVIGTPTKIVGSIILNGKIFTRTIFTLLESIVEYTAFRAERQGKLDVVDSIVISDGKKDDMITYNNASILPMREDGNTLICLNAEELCTLMRRFDTIVEKCILQYPMDDVIALRARIVDMGVEHER